MKRFPASALIILFGAVSSSAIHAQGTRPEPGAGKQVQKPAPLSISIVYGDGLTSKSGLKPRDLTFLSDGCPLTILVTNTTEQPIWLWKPGCPEGDCAVRLEFKRVKKSEEVFFAKSFRFYGGPGGQTKTVKLASGDTIVYRIDLLESYSHPFELESGDILDLFVRVVYESGGPFREVEPDEKIGEIVGTPDPNWNLVWMGKAESAWDSVRVKNNTERRVSFKNYEGTTLSAPDEEKTEQQNKAQK